MYTIKFCDALDIYNYPKEKADLILTDPPFMPREKPYRQRKGVENKLKDIINPSHDDFYAFWEKFLIIARQFVKDHGYLIFKADDYMARELYPLTNKYFYYSYTLIWNKKAIGLGNRVRKCHEVIEIYAVDRKKSYFKNVEKHEVHGKRTSTIEPLRSIITALSIRHGYVNSQKTPQHINQTNPKLWKEIIPRFCPQDGLVLDPFAGSCSILDAIISLNRYSHYSFSYFGMELDKAYVPYLKNKYRRPLDEFLSRKSKDQVNIIA